MADGRDDSTGGVNVGGKLVEASSLGVVDEGGVSARGEEDTVLMGRKGGGQIPDLGE